MKKTIIILILTLAVIAVAVSAQTNYDAIKEQLLGIMEPSQKEAFLQLTPIEQQQFLDQQITLANLAWQSEILVDCGGVCVEGLPAIWQVRLSNLGPTNFFLQSINLMDDLGNIFAQRSVNLTIPPNQVGTANLQGIVPPPSRGSTLYYRAVFVIEDTIQQEQSNRRMSLMALSDVECGNNATCKKDEFCMGFKCLPLTALPANKTGRAPAVFASNSVLYPIVIIMLLIIILTILITRKPHKKK